MMRIAAVPLVSALLLAGCQTTSTDVPAGGGDIIAQVTAASRVLCKFAPTAETIIAIVSGGNPALTTATAVAQAICAVVPPAGVLKSAGKGKVQTYGTVPGTNVRVAGSYTG